MIIVSFNVTTRTKSYLLKYKIGFVGYGHKSNNEVYPVQGRIVSPCTPEDKK